MIMQAKNKPLPIKEAIAKAKKEVLKALEMAVDESFQDIETAEELYDLGLSCTAAFRTIATNVATGHHRGEETCCTVASLAMTIAAYALSESGSIPQILNKEK